MFPLFPSLFLCFLSCFYFISIFQASFSGLFVAAIFYGLIFLGFLYFGFRPPQLLKTSVLLSDNVNQEQLSVSLDHVSVDNVSIDIMWSWLACKCGLSNKQSSPIILSVSGVHIVLSLKPDAISTSSDPDKSSKLNSTESIDAIVRSMHRRLSVLRPGTALLWLVGVELKQIKLEVHDPLHSTIFECATSVSVNAGRVDSLGEKIFLSAAISGAGIPMSELSRMKSFCRCSKGQVGLTRSIDLTIELPYPADVRTVPVERPVLLPSSLVLSLPDICISAKPLSSFTDMTSYLPLIMAKNKETTDSKHSKEEPQNTIQVLEILQLTQFMNLSLSISSLTLESEHGKVTSEAWCLKHSDVDCATSKKYMAEQSASFSMKSFCALVPVPSRNESKLQEVVSLSNLQLESFCKEDGDVPGVFVVRLIVGLEGLKGRVERSALKAVNQLIALIPHKETSEVSIVGDNSSGGGGVAGELLRHKLSVDLTLNKVDIILPMSDYLLEANSHLPSHDVNLAVRIHETNLKLKLSSCDDSHCGVTLKSLLFEEIDIDRGQCLLVEDLTVGIPIVLLPQSTNKSETVSMDVGVVRGRWSPLLTKCVGALAGGVCRELFDVIFDSDGPTPLSPLSQAVLSRVASPFTQDDVDQLLKLDLKSFSLDDVAVIISCKSIELEFPFKLWEEPDGELHTSPRDEVGGSPPTKCGAFLKGNEDLYGEWNEGGGGDDEKRKGDKRDQWECIAVKVEGGGTVVVKTPPGELPIIQMQLRSTELVVSGLTEWTQIAQASNPNCCLQCGNFALESFSDRVVELCISGVGVRWSPAMQLRIIKAARDVTHSVWESLLCYRILKYKDRNPDLLINQPLDSTAELLSIARKFKNHLSAAGEKLNRLYADTIHVEFASASPLENSSCFANVIVQKLWSLDLPEMWNIEHVSVALAGHPTLNLKSLNFKHVIDLNEKFYVGSALKELQCRYHCVSLKNKTLSAKTHTRNTQEEEAALKEAKQVMQSLIPQPNGQGREGFLIELSGLNIRVGTQFKIADTVADEAVQMQALVSAMLSLPGRWIPGCDDFKRLFRSSTTYESILFGDIQGPQPAPEMWVKLRDMNMSLGDDPMEAWMERAYPLWLDELERRFMREEQLRKRVVAIKVSNSEEGAAALSSAAELDFLNSNASLYIARAKQEGLSLKELQDETSLERADKLCISVSSCDMHALVPRLEDDEVDGIGSGGKKRGHELIRSLDSYPPPLDALFDVFAFVTFEVAACDLAVTVRRFKTPIFAAQAVKLQGKVLLTATRPPEEYYQVSQVSVDPGMAPQTVFQSFELPRVYLDFTGHVSHPVASYSPAYEFGLEEIAAGCGALYPESMTLDPAEKSHSLRWWDSGRRLITTRMDVTADDLQLSLLPSLQTFHHRYVSTTVGALSIPALKILEGGTTTGCSDFATVVNEHIASGAQEELRIICDLLKMKYERLNIYTDVRGLSCVQVPELANTLPLASLPCAVLTMSYAWECDGDAANYHFYPIVCESGEVVDLTPQCNASAQPSLPSLLAENKFNGASNDKFWSFRSHGLKLKLSAKLSLAPADLALHFNGDCSSLFNSDSSTACQEDNAVPSPIKRVMNSHEATAASSPVIVVYASSLAWLANWANSFKRIPNVPYPNKCRPALDSGIWGLKAHIRAISLENTGVDGVVKLVLFDKPRTDIQESQGVVVSAFGASVSMQVSEEMSHPNPFLTGKLSTDPDDPTRLWVVHGVSVSVGRMQGMVVEGSTSSFDQGLFVFSAASLGFEQSVVSGDGVTLRQGLETNRKPEPSSQPPEKTDSQKEESSNIEPLINSAEQASIPLSPRTAQASLYGLADSYINAVSIDDVRVCITVAARDSLISLGERVVAIIKETMPDDERPRDELMFAVKDKDAKKEDDTSMEGLSIHKFAIGSEESEKLTLTQVPTPASSLDTMGGLFLIRMTSIQIQALDLDSKSSILVALPSLIAQGWIGQTDETRNIDLTNNSIDNPELSCVRQNRSESLCYRGGVEERLQRLIRKELPRFVEATHIQIKGMSLLEAPSDLDGVANIRWLPSLGSAAVWNTGVFNTLLEPVSVIEVGVVVEHGTVPIHSLRVSLPLIELNIDSAAMRRSVKVATAMATLPERTSNSESSSQKKDKVSGNGEAQVSLGVGLGSESESPISSAWRLKQDAQWKLNNLRRLSRTLLLVKASGEVSEADMAALLAWMSATEKNIERAVINLATASELLGLLVADAKRMLQVQPHMHLVAFVGGVRIGLITTSRQPIASLSLNRISAIFANFLDQSGSLELDLYKLEAHFYNEEGEAHQVLEALDDACVRRIGSTLRKGGLGRMYLWDHIESMVRVQARLGTPHPKSGQFLDIRHFEVVVVPLFVHLTRRFVVSMADFFVPPNEASERKHDDQSRDSYLHGVNHHSGFSHHGLSNNKKSIDTASPPLSSQSSNVSNSSDSTVTSPLSGGSVGSRDARALLFGGGGGDGKSDHSDSGSRHTAHESKRSKDDGSFLKKKVHVQYLRLGQLVAFVSYRGENWAKLEDFDALQVKIHSYVVRDQTCTFNELAVGIRNHVVMDILSQVSRNFVNIGAFLATKFSGPGTCANGHGGEKAAIEEEISHVLSSEEVEVDGFDESGAEGFFDQGGLMNGSIESDLRSSGDDSSLGSSQSQGSLNAQLNLSPSQNQRRDTRTGSEPMPYYDHSNDRTKDGGRDLLLGPNMKNKKSSMLAFKKMNPFGKK